MVMGEVRLLATLIAFGKDGLVGWITNNACLGGWNYLILLA